MVDVNAALASKIASTELASELASRDISIASKANTSDVNSQISVVTTAVASKVSSVDLASQMADVNSALASKAVSTEVASELASRDSLIAVKASAIAVSALDSRVTGVERVVTAESGVSWNYLEAGADALVIRGPHEVAAILLGASAAALEGKVLFYKDVNIDGSLTMPNSDITTRALTVGGASLTTLLSAKENDFSVNLFLVKGFNTSGESLMRVDYTNTSLDVNVVRPISNPGVTVEGDLFVDGHLHYTTITSPYWVACDCIADGTISHQKGEYDIGIVKRSGDTAFDVTFPAHPEGDKYLALLSSSEFHIIYRSQTSTSLIIYLRGSTNAGATQGDGSFNIAILK